MNAQNPVVASRPRYLSRVVNGVATQDGAGVQLTRLIAQPGLQMIDPFLLMDAFRSDQPTEYLAGFPPHPHRGFETVTYILAGRMRHKDSMGHEGVIEPGGVQWMTAGRGVVHSEMPEQEEGLLEGFQLWVNLPAQHKMDAPAYQEYAASEIPMETREQSVSLRVIAGSTSRGTRGPVQQSLTVPIYLDVMLPPDSRFSEQLPESHNAFLLVVDGHVSARDRSGQLVELGPDDLGMLSSGDEVELVSGDANARFLLIAGRPLHEPVARGGPFVMNTRQEVEQAREDYEQGRF